MATKLTLIPDSQPRQATADDYRAAAKALEDLADGMPPADDLREACKMLAFALNFRVQRGAVR